MYELLNQLSDKPLVFVVTTDPEPEEGVVFQKCQCSKTGANPN